MMCHDDDTTKECLSREKDASIIMANFNGSLKAVDCRIRTVRYDMVQRSSGRLRRCSDADTTKECLS
eukprot:scaffold14141_cov146-Skeletonema_dohrnii-CCMP3373.AAC.4